MKCHDFRRAKLGEQNREIRKVARFLRLNWNL